MSDRKYFKVLPSDIVRVSKFKKEGISFSEHLTSVIRKDFSNGLGAISNYYNGYVRYHFRVLLNDKLPSVVCLEQKGNNLYEYLTDIPVVLENEKNDSDALFIRENAKMREASEIDVLQTLRLMGSDKLNLVSKNLIEFNKIGRTVIMEKNQKIKRLGKNSK